MNAIPDRITARVLLLDPERRLLLARYKDFANPSGPPFWATIGGEVEPGESIEAGARREIAEETGITGVTLGPIVWYGEWVLTDFEGRTRRFKESFIVAQTQATALSRAGWTPFERDMMLDARWWTHAEIAASMEIIYPRGLASLLPPILRGEYPRAVIALDREA